MSEPDLEELGAILNARDAALANVIQALDEADASALAKQQEIERLTKDCTERMALIVRLDGHARRLEALLQGKLGTVPPPVAPSSPPDMAALHDPYLALEFRTLVAHLEARLELLAEDIQQKAAAVSETLVGLDAKLERLTHETQRQNDAVSGMFANLETGLERVNERLNVPPDYQKQIDVLQTTCDARLHVIEEQQQALRAFREASLCFRLKTMAKHALSPRLGVLYQHPPIPLKLPASYSRPVRLSAQPRVSLVTPSYGQAEFIARTMDSVLGQGYPNLEYFVQDGGSTDGTVEILERYAHRLSGWESRPDGGQSQAINVGLAKCSGEIMGWLNSDDLLLPWALPHVVQYFNTHPDVDVVYGNRIIIDRDGKPVGRWVLPGHDAKVLKWADYVPQETLFWRRRIWDRVGGCVDESFHFAMDWDLLLRFQAAGAKFRHLPRFLGAFRVHEQQKTSAAINEVGFAEMARLRERCHGRAVTDMEIARRIAPFLMRHCLADAQVSLYNYFCD